MNKAFIITAVIAVAIVGMFFFLRTTEEPLADFSDETTSPLRIGEDLIYVPDQKPRDSVRIGIVSFVDDGFIVIHEDANGAPGMIIGNSALLPTGGMSSLVVDLSRDSRERETLFAMLHSDNGDGSFNPADDAPVRDAQGNVMFMRFQARSDADEPGEVSL